MTDYMFKNEARLGDAISLVAPVLYIAGAVIACLAIGPYTKIINQEAISA